VAGARKLAPVTGEVRATVRGIGVGDEGDIVDIKVGAVPEFWTWSQKPFKIATVATSSERGKRYLPQELPGRGASTTRDCAVPPTGGLNLDGLATGAAIDQNVTPV